MSKLDFAYVDDPLLTIALADRYRASLEARRRVAIITIDRKGGTCSVGEAMASFSEPPAERVRQVILPTHNRL